MSNRLSIMRNALAPATAGAALLALPGLAAAGAMASATAVGYFDLFAADPGITVTYEFDPADTYADTYTENNAIASGLQWPETLISENLFFQDQDSQSQAEAYPAATAGDLSYGYAALSNIGYIYIENSADQDGYVTLGWEYFLEAFQGVTGQHSDADTYAFAELVLFDDFFDLDVMSQVEVSIGGDSILTAEDWGEVDLFVPAFSSNVVTAMLNTEANAEFITAAVPAPSPLVLMAIGIAGLGCVRRRPRGG